MPAPSSLSTSPVFTMATTNLTKSYDKLINNGFHIDWPHENVSFSVAVVSMYQEKPDTPIWEYHHLADANTEGTKTLDRNSQWLIGSITKVFTDYLMLKSGIDIDRSVVEYLPELVNASSLNRWDDITLRMLGSHLAGVTADCKTPIPSSQGHKAVASGGADRARYQTVSQSTTF
jgi:actin-related protein 6